MTRSSRWITLAVTFALVIVAWFGFDFQGFNATPVEFDQTQWMLGRDQIKQNNDPGCVLGGMALHLYKNSRLLKLSYQDVYTLLGSPDSASDKAFLWELGQCHFGGWKNSQLRIMFDSQSRVKDVGFQESLL